MIKLRQFIYEYYEHYCTDFFDMRSSVEHPGWCCKDIPVTKPVAFYTKEWHSIDGRFNTVTLTLCEIKDGKIQSNQWYNGCLINTKDKISSVENSRSDRDIYPGPYFCLVIDDQEYWQEDIEQNYARIQSIISDYNTELYLKEIDG